MKIKEIDEDYSEYPYYVVYMDNRNLAISKDIRVKGIQKKSLKNSSLQETR